MLILLVLALGADSAFDLRPPSRIVYPTEPTKAAVEALANALAHRPHLCVEISAKNVKQATALRAALVAKKKTPEASECIVTRANPTLADKRIEVVAVHSVTKRPFEAGADQSGECAVRALSGAPKVLAAWDETAAALHTGDGVFSGDSVQTGGEERALVVWRSGTRILVREASEVTVISDARAEHASGPDVVLGHGCFEVKLPARAAELFVRTPHGEARLRGAETIVCAEAEQTSVSAVEGGAAVVAGGGPSNAPSSAPSSAPLRLDAGQGALVSAAHEIRVAPLPEVPVLTRPDAHAVRQREAPVGFAWTGAAQSYRVLVTADPDETIVLARTTSEHTQADLDLPNGDAFVTVVALSKDGLERPSATRALSVAEPELAPTSEPASVAASEPASEPASEAVAEPNRVRFGVWLGPIVPLAFRQEKIAAGGQLFFTYAFRPYFALKAAAGLGSGHSAFMTGDLSAVFDFVPAGFWVPFAEIGVGMLGWLNSESYPDSNLGRAATSFAPSAGLGLRFNKDGPSYGLSVNYRYLLDGLSVAPPTEQARVHGMLDIRLTASID